MRINRLEGEIEDLNLKFDYLVDTMQVFQSNINNNISWFYTVLGILIAVLLTALFFLVKNAVESGVKNGIEGSNDTIQREIALVKNEVKNVDVNLIVPTLLNAWYHNSSETAAYYKDYSESVHLQGIVENGVVGPNTVIFKLAKGYRPLIDMTFGITTVSSDTQPRQGMIKIEANGNVRILNVSEKIILNGIYFSTKDNLIFY